MIHRYSCIETAFSVIHINIAQYSVKNSRHLAGFGINISSAEEFLHHHHVIFCFHGRQGSKHYGSITGLILMINITYSCMRRNRDQINYPQLEPFLNPFESDSQQKKNINNNIICTYICMYVCVCVCVCFNIYIYIYIY